MEVKSGLAFPPTRPAIVAVSHFPFHADPVAPLYGNILLF
jgi:hypothetical protein